MSLMLAQPKIDMDSPVVPVASFDPPVIQPGDLCTYRVTMNALETSIVWPDRIPSAAGLVCRQGAHSQILALTGPLLVPSTTFNYRVRAAEAGEFSIPEFKVTVDGKPVSIPSARLEVVAAPASNVPPAQRLVLDLPTSNLFVGQAIRARVLLPGSAGGMVQSLGQVQVNGSGFIIDQSSAHARIEALPLGANGKAVNTFVYEMILTPIAVGKLAAFAQGYAAGNRVVGGIIMPGPGAAPGAFPRYTLLDSDPVEMDVRPLPHEGKLPGFAGAVGSFSIDAQELTTNVLSVGEPVELKVKIHGDGNLARLVPPVPPRLRDWQIFPSPGDNVPPQLVQVQNFTTFRYTLVPLTDQTHETPVLPFSAFDPQRAVYTDLTIPSIPVTVRPGTGVPADLATLIESQKVGGEPEREPVLSGLAISPGLGGGLTPVQRQAWFPLVQLFPACALLGLWSWDRRRRFLEQHPDVVLRRRARRALRRERWLMDKAARARDSARFAAAAINAMKVAVAPHYRAEPKALVGSDVIAVLPEAERAGRMGEVIRQFFTRSDACRFSSSSADTGELLLLQSDFERVLRHLEDRLLGPIPRCLPHGQSAGRLVTILFLCLLFGQPAWGSPAEALFRYATNAYYAGDYMQAAGAFAQAATFQPCSGALQNLGSSEWQRGRTGAAVLAWEQALWLDPFDNAARDNLRFARKTAQLESPELAWYEVVSSWLPANWWAWVAALSLWLTIAVSTLPGILRWRKVAWHQALAALGLAVFLLSVPAHLGVNTRVRLGFVVLKDAPLRLTPTAEAQLITRLPAGEPARLERERGDYFLLRASHAIGWIKRDQFKLVCSLPGSGAPMPEVPANSP